MERKHGETIKKSDVQIYSGCSPKKYRRLGATLFSVIRGLAILIGENNQLISIFVTNIGIAKQNKTS